MRLELTYDYEKEYEELQQCLNEKIGYRPSFDTTDFIPRVLPILGEIEPIRSSSGLVSATETLKNVRNTENYRIEGMDFSSAKMGALIKLLAFASRSSFIRGMTQNPRYATFTPLFMYAMKEQHGIKYDDWDKTDSHINYVLSNALHSLILMQKIQKFEFDYEEVEMYREKALTFKTGRKAGQMLDLTAYKMNLRLSREEVTIPKFALMMLLQTWLANVVVRVPDAMILDPWDWDNTPEPHDILAPKTSSTKRSIKLEDIV